MKRTKHDKNNLKVHSIALGVLIGLSIFFIFGIVTVLIKNPFFIRMTPVYWYDYVFLVNNFLTIGTIKQLYAAD